VGLASLLEEVKSQPFEGGETLPWWAWIKDTERIVQRKQELPWGCWVDILKKKELGEKIKQRGVGG